jgi:beta-N-acetylhexosaminidase
MVCVRAYNFKEKIPKMLSEGLISGLGAVIITQKGSRDLEPVIGIINEYKKLSKFPLLLYMDAECGIRDMFNFGTIFPSLMALGATRSKELAYKMGYIIGKEASAIGISMASNPVLDINNNPDNPIINTRAFSDNVELVIDLAGEYIKGIQEAGVIPNGKHFPGHGDTSVDSHFALPVVNHDLERLKNFELVPFENAIENDADAVMVAHILLKKIDPNFPSSLSKAVITDLLRYDLRFNGVVITDDMTMDAILKNYNLGDAAVTSVNAGADIILVCHGYERQIEVLNSLKKAVEDGKLTEDRIDESLYRILKLKQKYNLSDDAIDSFNIEDINNKISFLIKKYVK